MLFDIIPLEEFNKGVGKTKYSKRREMLEKMIETNLYIDVAPVLYKGDNMDIVLQLLGKFRDRGAEGLMCSLDKPYEFKRSKTLLKMKVMQTCDLKVIGFEEGQGKFANTLGKVICDYKGYELGVGSGWSDDMRNEVWNNQDKYLGKIAEIQYFEETNNDTGGISLRFPVFKTWRDDKNEESYKIKRTRFAKHN
jgi:DNA ligase-1